MQIRASRSITVEIFGCVDVACQLPPCPSQLLEFRCMCLSSWLSAVPDWLSWDEVSRKQETISQLVILQALAVWLVLVTGFSTPFHFNNRAGLRHGQIRCVITRYSTQCGTLARATTYDWAFSHSFTCPHEHPPRRSNKLEIWRSAGLVYLNTIISAPPNFHDWTTEQTVEYVGQRKNIVSWR